MRWPHFLIEELAYRRCTIVVGSGVSRSCQTAAGVRPAGWPELLQSLIGLITDPGRRDAAAGLLGAEQYLDAAQVIEQSTVAEDRERDIKRHLALDFEPSEWVRICRDFDQNVIVTTNYDCILEDNCSRNGFRTHIHKDKEAVKVIRSPERLIYKIHGCIRRDPGTMVLARSQYHWMRAEVPHCLALLEAIFATHTGLFLGYSMSDPDVQLVLQNVSIAFPYAQPHVMLVEEKMDSSVVRALEMSLNLHLVTYPRGDHAAGLEMLRSLLADVTSLRASIGA